MWCVCVWGGGAPGNADVQLRARSQGGWHMFLLELICVFSVFCLRYDGGVADLALNANESDYFSNVVSKTM